MTTGWHQYKKADSKARARGTTGMCITYMIRSVETDAPKLLEGSLLIREPFYAIPTAPAFRALYSTEMRTFRETRCSSQNDEDIIERCLIKG
jgi:hypothetical protein